MVRTRLILAAVVSATFVVGLTPAITTAAEPDSSSEKASADFSPNEGWYFVTVDEPKPRVSIIESDDRGVIVIKHGFASTFNLTTKWYDTVQELAPTKEGYSSTYRFADGRASLRTEMTRQPDGTILEEFVDTDGVQNRNILEFTGNKVITRRFRKSGAEWIAFNTTTKEGWSPARREENRLAELRSYRERELERERRQANLERIMEEDARIDEESRDWGRQAAEANERFGASVLSDLRAQADDAGRAAERSQRQLDQSISNALGRSSDGSFNEMPTSPSPTGSGVLEKEQAPASLDNSGTNAKGTYEFYLQVPVEAPDNTIGNTICVSNIVSMPSPAGWPHNTSAAEKIAESYFDRFLRECARISAPIGVDPPRIVYKMYDRGGELEASHAEMLRRANNFKVEM